MRSLRFATFGDPAEVLQLEEVPKPEAGPGEALVRMRARAVNPSDWLTVRGLYGLSPELPFTPGYEGMGVVESLGDGVQGVSVGQRVIPMGVSGTWQEYLVAPAAQLLPVPDAIPDATAAQFVVNPLTAWVMLTQELNIQPGQWLLQTAAGSTLGRVVIQMAKLRGFKTINVARRREQAEELKALGADEVICTADEDLVARVQAITEGKGVPAGIEAVGGKTGSDAVRALGTNGVLLLYGLLSGEPIAVHSGELLFRSATVRGFWLARWFRVTPMETQQATIAELMGLMALGKVVPPVEAEYDLADFQEALQRAQSSGLRGKVLLVG